MGDGKVRSFLEVNDITKCFKTNDDELNVLDHLTFSVKRSEFLTILGTSGCGKSTLLRCVGGFSLPEKGTVELEGKSVTKPHPSIAMVFQMFDQLFPWKTTKENLTYPIAQIERGISTLIINKKAEYYLEMMNLTPFASYYPNQLSGGMKQRVAIARALSLGAKVILMDEPFASLDAQTRTTLQAELLRIWHATGVTILFVTHNIWEAIILGSRILVLSKSPNNIMLDMENPVHDYKGEMRTPTDVGFTECWATLKDVLSESS